MRKLNTAYNQTETCFSVVNSPHCRSESRLNVYRASNGDFTISLLVQAGLRCYTCNNKNSMVDCSKNQRSMDCGLYEKCYVASYKLFSAWQSHHKGCVTETQCNSHKLCGAMEDDCLVSLLITVAGKLSPLYKLF